MKSQSPRNALDLKKFGLVFRGTRLRTKELFSQLCQIPEGWFILNLVYFSSFFLNLPSFSVNILKSQTSCNSDSGANVRKMVTRGICFTDSTQLLYSTSRKPHCQSIPRTCLTRNIKRNPNKHYKMEGDI